MPIRQSFNGFLLINKPPGPTSHDIVDAVRVITGLHRVGHAGTLDPFAQGLLIVGVGREATKRLDQFKRLPKTYRAVLHLGATSTTGDRTGEIREQGTGNREQPIEQMTVEKILRSFIGPLRQIPPMYSAKKVGGRKLYELAREGQVIDRSPISISISNLLLVDYQWPLLTIDVTCSAGTYIRQLAIDIGERLGTGAYCQELMRKKIGPIDCADALPSTALTPNDWTERLQPIDFLKKR